MAIETPRIFIPGPCRCFVNFRDWANSPLYPYTGWCLLGLAESGVNVNFRFMKKDIFTDDMGPGMPIDSRNIGQLAFISFRLIKYNEETYQHALNNNFKSVQEQFLNLNHLTAKGNIGSLLNSHGSSFVLCIVPRYADKRLANSDKLQMSRMPAGYTFWCCEMYDESGFLLSMRPKKPSISIRCIPSYIEPIDQYALYSPSIPPSLTGSIITDCESQVPNPIN